MTIAEPSQQPGSQIYQAMAFTFVGEKTAAGELDEIEAQQEFAG